MPGSPSPAGLRGPVLAPGLPGRAILAGCPTTGAHECALVAVQGRFPSAYECERAGKACISATVSCTGYRWRWSRVVGLRSRSRGDAGRQAAGQAAGTFLRATGGGGHRRSPRHSQRSGSRQGGPFVSRPACGQVWALRERGLERPHARHPGDAGAMRLLARAAADGFPGGRHPPPAIGSAESYKYDELEGDPNAWLDTVGNLDVNKRHTSVLLLHDGFSRSTSGSSAPTRVRRWAREDCIRSAAAGTTACRFPTGCRSSSGPGGI